jgi:hypothetical protein
MARAGLSRPGAAVAAAACLCACLAFFSAPANAALYKGHGPHFQVSFRVLGGEVRGATVSIRLNCHDYFGKKAYLHHWATRSGDVPIGPGGRFVVWDNRLDLLEGRIAGKFLTGKLATVVEKDGFTCRSGNLRRRDPLVTPTDELTFRARRVEGAARVLGPVSGCRHPAVA